MSSAFNGAGTVPGVHGHSTSLCMLVVKSDLSIKEKVDHTSSSSSEEE